MYSSFSSSSSSSFPFHPPNTTSNQPHSQHSQPIPSHLPLGQQHSQHHPSHTQPTQKPSYLKPFFDDPLLSPSSVTTNKSYSPPSGALKSPSRQSSGFAMGVGLQRIDSKNSMGMGYSGVGGSYIDENDYLGGVGRPRSPIKHSSSSMKLSPEDAPPMESLDEMDMGIGMNDGMGMGMGMGMSGSAAGNNMNSPMSPSDLVAARNKVVGNQGSTSSSNLFTSPSNNPSQPSNLYNKFISATPSSTSSYRQPTQQQQPSLATSSFSTQPSSFSSQPQAQGLQSQSQSYAPTSPHFTPDPAKTVTIFGFNPSQQNSIFQKFSRLGDIVYTDAAGAGKCFLIIMYNSKEAVDRALKLNGSFEDVSIIGVVPYQESHHKPKSPAAVSNTSAGMSTSANQTFGLTNQPRQKSQYSSPMNTTSSPMPSSVSPTQNQMQQNQFLNQQQQQAQQTPVSSTTTKVVYDANIFKRPGAASTSASSPSSSTGAYSRTLSSPSYRNQNSTGKSNIYPNVPNYSNILSNYNPRGQQPISNRPVQNGGQQVEMTQGQQQQQPQGWADWLKDKVLGW